MNREQSGAVAEFVDHLDDQIRELARTENKSPCAGCGMLTLLRIKRWELVNPPKRVTLRSIAIISAAVATAIFTAMKLLFK